MKMRNWAFAAIAAIIALSFAVTSCGDDSGGTSTVVWAPSVAVTGVTLDKPTMGLHIEDETGIALIATVEPPNAANKNVIWSVSPAGIISFDNGIVTPKGVGTATITVRTDDGGHKATCVVTVGRIPAGSIVLDHSTFLVGQGDFDVLTATVGPETAADLSVRWETSDSLIAIVDSDGTVYGISYGTVTITARTHNNLKAECTVIVGDIAVEDVTLEPEELELELFKTAQLSYAVVPPKATIQGVSWESSDSDTVSVNEKGLITALKVGPATITVTTDDGDFTATCEVTVWSTPVESVKVNRAEYSLMLTKTIRLFSMVEPEDASNPTVVWGSANTAFATVSTNGTVTPVAEGEVDITATSVDGAKVGTCKITVIPYVFPDNPMVWINPGTFSMGVPLTEVDMWEGYEDPPHSVTITKGFYIGKDAVSQALYGAIVGSNPSYFNVEDPTDEEFYEYVEFADSWAVEGVTWFDAIEFCNRLSTRDGYTPVYTMTGRTPTGTAHPITNATVTANWDNNGYRLPTEAEWEYACRADTSTPFNIKNPTTSTWGMSYITTDWANFYPWPYDGHDTEGENWWLAMTVPWLYFTPAGEDWGSDGLDHANQWGLYNMHGNVSEWCWDYFAYYPTAAQTDPRVSTQSLGNYRIVRGGSWYDEPQLCRSGTRAGYGPGGRYLNDGYSNYPGLGFRLVRNGTAPTPSQKTTVTAGSGTVKQVGNITPIKRRLVSKSDFAAKFEMNSESSKKYEFIRK
jgi:uncharacterized protein YjdB